MPAMWLHPTKIYFPKPETFDTPDVVAFGGDLSPERLLFAYSLGIFPWYNEGEPILWWSPDPRMVLFPKNLKVAKSMRPYFNQNKFRVTFNQCFPRVMRACMNIDRDGQDGSWINENMVKAYSELHTAGFAHSVEVWQDDALVGGLYGIAIGRIFFGESMFAKVANASKFGFISLVQLLQKLDFQLIDCQQNTKHLSSLGAYEISRAEFYTFLEKNQNEPNILRGYLSQQ